MQVSRTTATMGDAGNTATLFFSNSNSTSASGTGVASGTGSGSVTIDCSNLDLNTGYITASGAVRIWNISVTYTPTSSNKVATPTFSPSAGEVASGTVVSFNCITEGVTYYYTTDGTDPTISSSSSSSWSLPRLGIFVSLITLGYSLWHAALSGTGFICSFLVEAGPWKPV